MRLLLGGLLFSAIACSSPPAPPAARHAEPASPPATPAVAEAKPPATAAEPEPDPCPKLGPDEVSDDETPSIAGTTGETEVGPWLEARGVTEDAFRAWILARDRKHLDDFDAETLFSGSCPTLTVGDAREEALICTLSVRTSIMRYSALAFVVRNQRLAPVLEVGYALPAMDWPEMRWLDLQLTFSADGKEANLHDRAKPGTFLVSPPSACREHHARYLACEKAHREGGDLSSLCPPTVGPNGTISSTVFGHYTPLPATPPGDRAQLYGCEEGLKGLDRLLRESRPVHPSAAEFRQDRAFASRACKARGRYLWKNDRFVRDSSG